VEGLGTIQMTSRYADYEDGGARVAWRYLRIYHLFSCMDFCWQMRKDSAGILQSPKGN